MPVGEVQTAKQQLGFLRVMAQPINFPRGQQSSQCTEVVVLIEMEQDLPEVEVLNHDWLAPGIGGVRHRAQRQGQAAKKRLGSSHRYSHSFT